MPDPLPNPVFDPAAMYRPLRCGIRIENPAINEVGTLGFLATDQGKTFLVSCRHVLQGCDQGPTPGIFQPALDPANLVSTGPPRIGVHDCAAVEVPPTVLCVGGVDLNLGAIKGTAPLQAGMAVHKCGATTGITEGEVRVIQSEFLVAPPPGAPPLYLVTDTGDSGALFLDSATNNAVALCRGARVVGGRTWAVIVPIADVLGELGIQFL